VARRLAVFLSYQTEDSAAREDFVTDVTGREPAVRFFDYPVTDSFDVNWKARCTALIRQCHGTVVLVGRTTFQSTAPAKTARTAVPRRKTVPVAFARRRDAADRSA
jgi:hypothetical protein